MSDLEVHATLYRVHVTGKLNWKFWSTNYICNTEWCNQHSKKQTVQLV